MLLFAVVLCGAAAQAAPLTLSPKRGEVERSMETGRGGFGREDVEELLLPRGTADTIEEAGVDQGALPCSGSGCG